MPRWITANFHHRHLAESLLRNRQWVHLKQKRVIINTLHPFRTKVYDPTPEIKAALEVLLFALAEGELEAEGAFEFFYRWVRPLRQ